MVCRELFLRISNLDIMLVAGIYLLIGVIVLILLLYVIVNRIEEKKNEKFEKRDF